MFSPGLASSGESRWRKLGSMLISFTGHIAVAAILLISPVLVTKVWLLVDSRPPTLVVCYFSVQPGDPSQKEPQPNTLHIPHGQIINIHPNISSKIKLEPVETVEPTNDLLVISQLIAPNPTVDRGHYGAHAAA